LAIAARQLLQDWQHRYGFCPLLLETFVENTRFTGMWYRASNWIHIGQTQSRGKLSPTGKQSAPYQGRMALSFGESVQIRAGSVIFTDWLTEFLPTKCVTYQY